MSERAGPSPARRLRLPFRRSLSLRLAALLTVAMLPLALIAIWQTARLERELDQIDALNLATLTARAARIERESIESAFGAAQALASVIPEISDDPAECLRVFTNFLDRSDGGFVFGGFVPPSGIMTCSSSPERFDFSENATFQEIIRTGKRRISVNNSGAVSRQSVIVASLPVHDDGGRMIGVLSVSVPHNKLDGTLSDLVGEQNVDLITINRDGDILTTNRTSDNAASGLPGDRPAAALIDGPRQFIARNGRGERRVYSVVPIAAGSVYAVGAWPPHGRTAESLPAEILTSPALFPIAMWVASVALIFLGVERMVVRHVRVIGRQMRLFGRHRVLPDSSLKGALPSEVAAIEEEFSAMAARLVHDEAELLDAMHDKDVLLKEVHHRVKNNLQLISSIINMQVRQSETEDTTAALQAVNRRVTGMAAVHRRLYQAENLGRVQADDLLRDVVAPLIDLAPPGRPRPRVELRLDPITLYPDQAVPAALLTVEAVTNALKYLQPDGTGESWLRVSLEDLGEGKVRIATESSVAPDRPATGGDASATGSGLGSRLIAAFARQLDSRVEVDDGPGSYRLSVAFDAQPFRPEEPG